MPIYDFKCLGDCGFFHDIIVSLQEKEQIICPSCEGQMRTIISAVATIGPMPSKPLVVKQVGKSFDSVGEWNKYQREHPDVEILSAGSDKWQKHKDTVREKAESRAKQHGFRDFEDRQTQRTKRKAKRASAALT
jgi:putative FmdB family regulatory protein